VEPDVLRDRARLVEPNGRARWERRRRPERWTTVGSERRWDLRRGERAPMGPTPRGTYAVVTDAAGNTDAEGLPTFRLV